MKRVVLVRPSGPRNAGLIVRTSANFGPVEVCFAASERPALLLHPEFEQMSHGVSGVPERILQRPTLRDALADCTRAVGFTARVRDKRSLVDFADAQQELRELCDDPEQRVALVFGNEVTGLSGEESDQCHELVRLPTSREHTSLNLAIAVGVVLFSLFQGRALATRSKRAAPLPGEAREYLKLHLKDTLGAAALSKAAKRDIEDSIERVFSRAVLESRDARAWHAILRALGNRKTPTEYGIADMEKQVRKRRARARAQERDALPEGPGRAAES